MQGNVRAIASAVKMRALAMERAKAQERERLERAKAQERERIERAKAQEQERLELERAFERERLALLEAVERRWANRPASSRWNEPDGFRDIFFGASREYVARILSIPEPRCSHICVGA